MQRSPDHCATDLLMPTLEPGSYSPAMLPVSAVAASANLFRKETLRIVPAHVRGMMLMHQTDEPTRVVGLGYF